MRVVRSPEGRVEVDGTGRANGRGAYLHAERACWEKALKGGTIARALKTTPAPDELEALRAYSAALPAGEGEAR